MREDPPLCRLDRVGADLGADGVTDPRNGRLAAADAGLLDAVPDHAVRRLAVANADTGERGERKALQPRDAGPVQLGLGQVDK